MKNKKAVTLVELIVGVTISMLLMVSVGVFLGSGLKNIFLQEKSITNKIEINSFYNEIFKNIGNFEKNLEILGNGIIFQRKTEFNEGGFSYIGTENFDYCGVGNNSQKRIFIKNFIPNSYEKVGNFEIKENQIFENGSPIIGKKIFGKEEVFDENPENIFLNNPTNLLQIGNFLYISDTLNNRILKYNTISKKIYNFLDENDGISLPTGLFKNNGNIFIANSGVGEILKYSNELTEDYNLKTNIFPKRKIEETNNRGLKIIIDKVNFINFDKINLVYKENSINGEEIQFNFPTEITLASNIFQKNGEIKKEKNFRTISYIPKESKLKNFFDYEVGEEKILDENNDNIKNFLINNKIENIELSNLKAKFEQKYSTIFDEFNILGFYNSGNILVKIFTKKIDEDGNETEKTGFYELELKEKEIDFNFPEITNKNTFNGKIFARIDFLKNGKRIFSINEKKIFENDKIKLEKIAQNKKFPYKINSINSFVEFDVKNPGNFINFDENNDIYLDLPIKSLETSKDGDFLNIIIKYYRNFDCEDLDLNEQKINTILIKKNLK